MLDTVTDHFIICGYGRIGRLVAAQLSRQQIPFVIVERDPGRLKTDIDDGALAVEGDASGEDMLKRVGIDRARGLIAAVGTDAENVYAVLTAGVLRPDLFIVSRADTDDATMKLKRAGMEQIPIGGGSSLANQSILRAHLRQRFGVIVVGIQRQDLRMEFNPEPETAIRPGNKLVVLGRPESLKRLEAEASS
jgi:voltage-gated potassium channel